MREDYKSNVDMIDHLECYFNGELNKTIQRLKRLVDREFNEDHYCTLNALNLRPGKSSNSSGHADFTSARAIQLADIQLSRKRLYKRHIELKKAIENHLSTYTQEEIKLLKAELGITESTKTEIIKNSSFSYTKARIKINEILNELNSIIGGAFNESN